MIRVALTMLAGDRAKYTGLVLGIAFTSFLVTFAMSYFCGFMTWGFALVSENPGADIWVMDPAVESAEQTINLPASVLGRVRSVEGVLHAEPLALGMAEARFPNGQFQSFQVIGVDDVTLAGAPRLGAGDASVALRLPYAAIVDAGGTEGKLETPSEAVDLWPLGAPHLQVPVRDLEAGDDLLVNDHRVQIAGHSAALPRFPPRPLLYMTLSNADRVLAPEHHRVTFILATVTAGASPDEVAARIEDRTGLRARSAADFKADNVKWFIVNSEDVGDIGAMLALAGLVGFGVTGVMLYMFTTEHLTQYALLKAMGATSRQILGMVLAQAAACAGIGTGLGLGACAVAGSLAGQAGYPFRMMWIAPVLGGLMVMLVSVVAALISARPALGLAPGVVFSGR